MELRQARHSRRLPGQVWFVLAMLAAVYYGIFYSDSPRLWAFAIAYWMVAAAFFYCYTRIQPFDILSPIIGLIVLLFLYSFASALYIEKFGAIYFGDAVNDLALRTYYGCCLAGLAGLTVGAQLASRMPQSLSEQKYERSFARLKRPDTTFRRRLMFWSVVIGATFGVVVLPQFNVFHVSAYSERAFALRIERAENASAGLRDVFMSRLPSTYILCSATLLMLAGGRRWKRLIGLSVFMAYVIANTLAGWRGTVVAALLIPLVYYHYRVKEFSVRFALVAGLSVYVFVNALSVVRVSSHPLEMVALLRDNVTENGLAFASLSSSGELLVGGNLAQLISGIQSKKTDFTYGKSVLDDLLVFVPRSIYPNRPLPLSEKYVEVFYPGLLENGGGRGLFILQDGYWAFGIAGVFLFMLAYGWLSQRVYRLFMNNLTNDLAILWYSAVYNAIVLAAIRTGMVGSLKSTLISSIPFIVLLLLVKLRLPTPGRQRLELNSEIVRSS